MAYFARINPSLTIRGRGRSPGFSAPQDTSGEYTTNLLPPPTNTPPDTTPDLSLGGALKKSENDYNITKQAINDAYAKGVMTPAEVSRYQTQAFQNTRAQYANLRRSTAESGYNRVNTGAMQGKIRDIGMGEIGALGAGRFRINQARDTQNANAARWKAGAYADLMSRRQIPWSSLNKTSINTTQPGFGAPPPLSPTYQAGVRYVGGESSPIYKRRFPTQPSSWTREYSHPWGY